ncbi:HD-GYP domain-containing protein [Cohnella sp. 56]|uniref:HD-GYP domain-containing protein n=1 Tax=Cohnella sp. 56 TaxID=3113722 RepID=UPI0030E7E465
MNERQKLLDSYYQEHQRNLNLNILKIAFAYLLLSLGWNAVFAIFNIHYSRANIEYLLTPVVLLLVLLAADRRFRIRPIVMQHIVMLFLLFVASCLYLGSGYHEAWAYFLAIPILAGLYGNLRILFFYSVAGLAAMFAFTKLQPQVVGGLDSIDLSNRILLYIVLGTFSYLLSKQLNRLYNNQVNLVEESMATTIEQVVKTFIVSVEAKDSYTFGHSERVSKYAVELASLLPEFADKQRLETLRLSGLLHDIGKINIPEAVLTKPTRLTEEEYALIKTHTIVGGKMVEKISGLGQLKPGVLYHHERWDGGGYPSGKTGTEIPLEARILSIADTFDAMTSNRSYRASASVMDAVKQLKQGSGTQFDPQLIAYIDEVLVSWLRIYKEYNEDLIEFETMFDLI